MNHDKAVTKHLEPAQESLEDGFWDDVYRELSYFEEQTSPSPPYPDEKGLEVGEFDILLLNYEERIGFYKEVKTNPGERSYAEEQIERAQRFFKDEDWEMYGCVVVEPR